LGCNCKSIGNLLAFDLSKTAGQTDSANTGELPNVGKDVGQIHIRYGSAVRAPS